MVGLENKADEDLLDKILSFFKNQIDKEKLSDYELALMYLGGAVYFRNQADGMNESPVFENIKASKRIIAYFNKNETDNTNLAIQHMNYLEDPKRKKLKFMIQNLDAFYSPENNYEDCIHPIGGIIYGVGNTFIYYQEKMFIL